MISEEIKKFFKGEVAIDQDTLEAYSRDASLFEIKPELVVFPRDREDLKKLVSFVATAKLKMPDISLTARSGGTDMTGGPINHSIIVDFKKHLNQIKEIGVGYATTEPGVFYRDFENETLKKGYLLPSYPASREICTVGGMVANNAGGEKSLIYGKTENYVEKLKMVLSDAKEYEFGPLVQQELEEKMKLDNFEGEIYRKVFNLIKKNYDLIIGAKPAVSKNSAGFNIWNIWDKKTFDLTKLFIGAQGTLGLITEIKFKLVKVKSKSAMIVIFLNDLKILGDLVKTVLISGPSSFESFDDHTLKLALKFFPDFMKVLGARNLFSLGFSFLPEFWLVATSGMPKLVMLVEFEGNNLDEIHQKLSELKDKLKDFNVKTRLAKSDGEIKKYWIIRRESFNLLRKRVQGKKTAPFIDDLVVKPEYLPQFLPKLYEILDRYDLLYTIAGHVGDGNLHIIPLMNLSNEKERGKIRLVADEVYDLVFKFKGSTTAEHNDGLIRGSYLEKMYGPAIYKIFLDIKRIFDPAGIFNPGKKIGVNFDEALSYIRK